jgi:hypothetical protein
VDAARRLLASLFAESSTSSAALVRESPLALAAVLMNQIRMDVQEQWVTYLYRASLAAIRPQLAGVVAEDADVVLWEDARRDVA